MDSIDLLDRLIAFPTVSRDPNRDLIAFVAERLRAVGADVSILPDETGAKPISSPGSVPRTVPASCCPVIPMWCRWTVQAWTVDPFRLTRRDGRLYGRGTADMKGFVASALAAAERAATRA